MATLNEDLRISGELHATSIAGIATSITNAMCSSSMELARTKLAQDTLAQFAVPLTSFRVHDALQTNLPGTAATDDLALLGTFASTAPHLSAGDLKAAGATTRYGRALVLVPECYDAAETVNIQVSAGMVTTVADASCTVDVSAYRSDEITGISADLCTTAATSMNSLTFADYSFVLTATALVPGDVIDVRIAVLCTDAATGTAVKPTIGAVNLLCDIRG